MREEIQQLFAMIDTAETEFEIKQTLFTILQNAPVPMWVKKRRGNKDYEMWFVNKFYAAKHLNDDPETYIGKNDFDIWDKETAEAFVTNDEEVYLSREPILLTEDVPDKSSTKYPSLIYKWPVYGDNVDLVCGIELPAAQSPNVQTPNETPDYKYNKENMAGK